MTKEETIAKIKALVEASPSSYTRKLAMAENASLLEALQQYLPAKVQSDFYSLKTKVYWLLNGLTDFPKCIACEKELSDKQVKDIFKGYHQCCSPQCGKNSERRKQLYREACLKKYGVENASQSTEVKQQKAKTSRQHFGVDNPAQAKAVQDQIKQTTLRRYGVEHAFQNEDVLAKAVETMQRKYGVKHALQLKQFQDKASATTMAHFGVCYPMQSRTIRLKSQTRYLYNGINFDSKPELALFIYLTENSVEFEYQPDVLFEYSYNGKTCIYMPDFKIGQAIYEIKGRHFFKDDGTMQNPYDHSLDGLYEAKHQCMLANDVKILLDNDAMIAKAESWIAERHGRQYLDSFKKNAD